ncbi:189_t:CDS:2 [Entrophospora sp. SA101]|nr:189_t:CDS:2 [Entrophospora sp. SA101]
MIAVIETENQALRWLNKAKRNEFLVFENNYDTFTKEKIIENSPDIVLKKVYSNKIQRRFSLLNLKLNDLYTIKEFVKELQDHQRIQNHENIINFYGIFEDSTQENIYSLILDYTKDNLHKYLSTNDLSWTQKLKLAKELTSALYCLHVNNIVHGGLTSKNINILNGSVRLHNFGSFKRLIRPNQQHFSHYFNSIQYLDPQYLKNPEKKCFIEDQKKADIYSLGILFWEISSGKIPFENKYIEEPCKLCYMIVYENLREEQVKDTPEFYEKLYKSCWRFESEERPDIEQDFDPTCPL